MTWALLPFTLFAHILYPAETTPTPTVEIALLSPQPGEVLKGTVTISGTAAVDDFQRAEVLFGYAQDLTNTWFILADIPSPVTDAPLATWDTTQITDGNYILRLVVYTQDEQQLTTTVPNLRVRNYTPIETDTPTSTETALPGATSSPTATSVTPSPLTTPTHTPLPPNPLTLHRQQISFSLMTGVVGTASAFGVLGLYLLIRKALRR
jgi:hypothetical protein